MKHTRYFIGLFFLVRGLGYGYPHDMEAHTIQNWETASIDSKILLDIHKSRLQMPADRNAAYHLIEQNKASLLKNVYLSLLVDSSHRVGNYIAQERITLTDINTVINSGTSTSPVLSHKLQKAVVYHQNPLQAIANLFIQHNEPYTPSYFSIGSPSKIYTGILIDARNALPVHGEYTKEQLNPCLFPKIWDKKMNLLYEKNVVSPDVACKQSIVLYTGSMNEDDYRDRIGTEPLRIIARGVFGDNRTDPIISTADAEKIMSKEENIRLLREGRIVIVCDKDTLAFSPPYPLQDESFYFTYHDISTVFLDKIPEKISVRTEKNMIKIIVYDIRFIADSPQILPGEESNIDVIAHALKKVGNNAQFIIEGHTANLNRPQAEKRLSLQRADKIAEELAKRGIPADKMKTAGYGATKPIAPSDNPDNKAKNRRVEIIVIRD